MVEEHTKNKLLMLEVMVALVLLVFVGAYALNTFFPTEMVPYDSGTAGIVGFVPIEIKSQPISLDAKEPTSFLLFSEKEELFNLTSLRLSGKVTGEGRAEIILDNGLGQELLIYSNVKQKSGNLITGMSVSEQGEPLPEGAKKEQVAAEQAWLKIAPDPEGTAGMPRTELGNDKKAEPGEFQHSCVDTCYMNMKMQKGLYYSLKIRVDPGTEVVINELNYMLEV